MIKVEGLIEPGFELVADAFRANFAHRDEVGAAYCVYADGRRVVDIWAGVADPSTGKRWQHDTLQLVFSTTKGAAAACVNLLADRGTLDINAPVARYWPEFAQAGKEDIPVRWLMSHQAGLPVVEAELTLPEALAWEPVVEALAAQSPLWEPGTAHGYHVTTFGWLVGELVRRVDGRTIGRFFAEEIADRLDLDFWIGLPPELVPRVAPLVGAAEPGGFERDPEIAAVVQEFAPPGSLLDRAMRSPSPAFDDTGIYNRPEILAVELPHANGVTDARSLARLYAAHLGPLADGSPRLLSEGQVQAACTAQTAGDDLVDGTGPGLQYGLGYFVSASEHPGGGGQLFGHAGFGGSVGAADRAAGLAMGYVMNNTQLNLNGDERALSLILATYLAVGAELPEL